jgi:hypothetical protein
LQSAGSLRIRAIAASTDQPERNALLQVEPVRDMRALHNVCSRPVFGGHWTCGLWLLKRQIWWPWDRAIDTQHGMWWLRWVCFCAICASSTTFSVVLLSALNPGALQLLPTFDRAVATGLCDQHTGWHVVAVVGWFPFLQSSLSLQYFPAVVLSEFHPDVWQQKEA